MKSTMHLLKNTARMLAIIDWSTRSIIHLMNVWVERYQTFLGSGEVLGVRHLGSKLSILLQEISEGEKDDGDNLSSQASRERQEILEVQAQGNKRNSCLLLNKRQSSEKRTMEIMSLNFKQLLGQHESGQQYLFSCCWSPTIDPEPHWERPSPFYTTTLPAIKLKRMLFKLREMEGSLTQRKKEQKLGFLFCYE